LVVHISVGWFLAELSTDGVQFDMSIDKVEATIHYDNDSSMATDTR